MRNPYTPFTNKGKRICCQRPRNINPLCHLCFSRAPKEDFTTLTQKCSLFTCFHHVFSHLIKKKGGMHIKKKRHQFLPNLSHFFSKIFIKMFLFPEAEFVNFVHNKKKSNTSEIYNFEMLFPRLFQIKNNPDSILFSYGTKRSSFIDIIPLMFK